jgi:hypothetical protein
MLSHCHLTKNAGNAGKISRVVPKSPTKTRSNQIFYIIHLKLSTGNTRAQTQCVAVVVVAYVETGFKNRVLPKSTRPGDRKLNPKRWTLPDHSTTGLQRIQYYGLKNSVMVDLKPASPEEYLATMDADVHLPRF